MVSESSSAKQTDGTAMSEREAFERAMRNNPGDAMNLLGSPWGVSWLYNDPRTNAAWVGWQSRALSTAPEAIKASEAPSDERKCDRCGLPPQAGWFIDGDRCPGAEEIGDCEGTLRASPAAPAAAPVPSEPTVMPTYGEVSWKELIEAVNDATGSVKPFDDKFYIGHQMAGINMNSLNRIVSYFIRRATAPKAEVSGSGSAEPSEALNLANEFREGMDYHGYSVKAAALLRKLAATTPGEAPQGAEPSEPYIDPEGGLYVASPRRKD